jgi:hypothetical protein
MKRHEWWRLNYRNGRDLDHLSPEELSERLSDCINNIRMRTVRGKLGLLYPGEPLGERWMILLTEVLEECNLRGYAYPGPISIAKYRSVLDHAFDPIPDMDKVFADLGLGGRPFLLKFGDARWLRLALSDGRVRVGSASYYDSDSHNHARRDTELQRLVKLNPTRSHVGVGAADPDGWSAVASPTDYFLYSMSGAYGARLFGDFASSACLVIFDPTTFLQRLTSAFKAKWPGWRVEALPVKYYDPVRVDPNAIVVPQFKPFKHAYQAEVRVVGVPRVPVAELDPFEVELGPLNDCAVLVDLSSHPPKALPHDPTEDPIRVFGTTAPRTSMVNELPTVASMQGILLDKSAPSDEDWYFQVQYTDTSGAWHQLRVPVRDGLYLLNLLQAAQDEQASLALMNRRP